MDAIVAFLNVAVKPGRSGVRSVCMLRMAECDVWPGGEVAQPQTASDLGTQPFTMPAITECQSIHETHVRVIRFVLANWAQDVMLQFWGPTGMQCMAHTENPLLYI
jgi:hypothetical protein